MTKRQNWANGTKGENGQMERHMGSPKIKKMQESVFRTKTVTGVSPYRGVSMFPSLRLAWNIFNWIHFCTKITFYWKLVPPPFQLKENTVCKNLLKWNSHHPLRLYSNLCPWFTERSFMDLRLGFRLFPVHPIWRWKGSAASVWTDWTGINPTLQKSSKQS